MYNDLTIITVNYQSSMKLNITLNSVSDFISKTNLKVEYILIDGGSSDLNIKEFDHIINKFVTEPDDGIYDAMNKGQMLATSKYLLFLNAGDKIFCDEKEHNLSVGIIECRLKGKHQSFWGRHICMGTPYCHQQVIFPNKKDNLYDLNYKISADMKYMIDLNCHKKLKHISGLWVEYDLDGISQENYIQRDREIFQILFENRYILYGIIFYGKSKILHFIRRIMKYA